MKNLYVFIFLFITSYVAQAQIVDIPNANFKNALVNSICADFDGDGIFESDVDLNDDGEIQIAEAESVLNLGVNSNNILSLEGIDAFVNLQGLDCSNNYLSTLDVSALTSLTFFNCYGNNLSVLDVNELTNLLYLYCGYNQLTSLDVSSLLNLVELNCADNFLTTINFGDLTNLTEIQCYRNELTTLDLNLLTNLNELGCSENQITSLDLSSLTSLNTLYCSDNLLTSLDVSQLINLTQITCHTNQLTELDVSTLTDITGIACGNNQLTEIDVSNNPNLLGLNCINNQITSLDITHLSELTLLSCTGNMLTTLDISDLSNLSQLYCDSNQLETLFAKTGSQLTVVYFNSNPNLEYICVNDYNSDYFNYLVDTVYEYENCTVNSYCSFVPGGEFYTVEGDSRFDSNSDGCDSSDISFPNLNFNITDGINEGTVISNVFSNYSLPLQEGAYTITPTLENPTYFNVSPLVVSVDFPSDGAAINQDFCISPNGVYNDLEVVLIPISDARPGFESYYRILYKNKGTTVLSGSVAIQFDDNYMNFISANPAADNSASGSLVWDFTDLEPFETREITYVMNLNTPTNEDFPLNSDDILEFTAEIQISETDETPEDNTFTLSQVVVNSFDPNDKRCLEGETITPEMVGRYVHYMIRFENTGTANAINVVVRDVIDMSKFDVSTLVPLTSSHDVVTRIQNTNEVEFIFENIDLPFDDANNDGFVVFKIKTLESLTLGDSFSNDAEIYFDFNAPIITNDFVTSIEEPLSIRDFDHNSQVDVFPNPVSNLLHITSEQALDSATIYDINGRELLAVKFREGTFETSIDVGMLNQGIYMVKLNSSNAETIQKIIKN